MPFSIFRIEGLAAADATQVIAQAGFLSMFFFITLYMQNVLGFSPIAAGTAYLPVTVGVGIAAGISTGLVARIGTRPIIVAGAVIGAGGVYWLSRIPVHGSYLTDLLPGLVVMALGLGAVMVGVQNAANAGVPADKAGLAAALITTSSTVGAALGLAILTAIATSRTNHLIAAHAGTRARPHRRVPRSTRRLQRLPRRRGSDRRPRHQHPRAAGDRRRTGSSAGADSRSRVTAHPRRRVSPHDVHRRTSPVDIARVTAPGPPTSHSDEPAEAFAPTTRLSTDTHHRPIKARRSGALRRRRFAATARLTPPANSLRCGALTHSCLGRPAIARKTCFARVRRGSVLGTV